MALGRVQEVVIVRTRLIATLSLTCCAAVVLGGPGVATTTAASLSFGARPCSGRAIAPTAGGGVLLRVCGRRSNSIARIRPNGTVTRLAEVRSEGGPILEGPAGEVWAAGAAEGAARVDRIAPDGKVRQFDVGPWKSGDLWARGIVVATVDGSVWVALAREMFSGYGSIYDTLGGELVRISRQGKVAHFRIPKSISPQGLALGADGSLWFTGVAGRFLTEHGATSSGTGYVGRMTPSGSFATFELGEGSLPGAIAAGPDGDLWFTREGLPQTLVSIGTDGAFGATFALGDGGPGIPGGPPQSTQGSLVFGPEADAWTVGGPGLTRVTPSGQATLFTGAHGTVATFGTKGDLWVDGRKGLRRIEPG